MKGHPSTADPNQKILDRLLTEGAREILDSGLTESDMEKLHNIKHELGICVRWGRFTKETLDSLLVDMDTLIFLKKDGEGTSVKRNPYEALFENDKDLLLGASGKSKLARQYVMLSLVKKLCGSLKTLINQELAGFEIIDEHIEGELLHCVNIEESVLMSPADDDSPEITATLERGKVGSDCTHRRTTFRQVYAHEGTASDSDELHEFCKDCRRIVNVRVLSSKTAAKRGGRALVNNFLKRACPHREGSWKKGEEGKVALCSSCGEPIPNPGKLNWVSVGLEPYGDNPEQDVIVRFSGLSEMEE
jgi:hypothetical protein